MCSAARPPQRCGDRVGIEQREQHKKAEQYHRQPDTEEKPGRHRRLGSRIGDHGQKQGLLPAQPTLAEGAEAAHEQPLDLLFAEDFDFLDAPRTHLLVCRSSPLVRHQRRTCGDAAVSGVPVPAGVFGE